MAPLPRAAHSTLPLLRVWVYACRHGSDEPLPSIKPYPNEEALLAYAGERLKAAVAKTGKMPRVHVMGALGRCGTGACDLATKAGIPRSVS